MIFELLAPIEPPAQFDHRYAGTMVSIVAPLDEADAICRAMEMVFYGETLPDDHVFMGCAFWANGHCIVVAADRKEEPTTEQTLRHERAHCNGWAADHPE